MQYFEELFSYICQTHRHDITHLKIIPPVNYVLISIFAFLDKRANKRNFYARTEDTCSSSTINRLVADPSLCFCIAKCELNGWRTVRWGSWRYSAKSLRVSEGSSRVVVEGDAIATIPSRTSLIISWLSSSVILDSAEWPPFVACSAIMCVSKSQTIAKDELHKS